MPLRTHFYRIAAEGDTVDGRTITREMLEQMAEDYDPKRYGAKIWLEHFHGVIPGGPFDSLGDVVALKAEEITDVPALNGKMGLYAQSEPQPAYVDLINKKQKNFHSMEVMTNFAKTGRPYLVGVAALDEPASQGTEMLAFAASGSDVFCGDALAVEISLMEEETNEPEKASLYSKIKKMITGNKNEHDKFSADVEASVLAIAESQQASLDNYSSLNEQLIAATTANESFKSDLSAQKTAHDELLAKFNGLVEQLGKTEAFGHQNRPAADGGDGTKKTDC